jgi:anti-sigma B factor antagonist
VPRPVPAQTQPATGQYLHLAREEALVPGIRSPLMINGVAVVAAPAEIDLTAAGQLRMILLRASARRLAAIVVDMTRTQFCDSAGLTVLVRAHRRAAAEGGELRLVLSADRAVRRIFAITGLDRVIPVLSTWTKPWPRARGGDPAIAPASGAWAPPCPAAKVSWPVKACSQHWSGLQHHRESH